VKSKDAALPATAPHPSTPVGELMPTSAQDAALKYAPNPKHALLKNEIDKWSFAQ
jgi:hypothetical protein